MSSIGTRNELLKSKQHFKILDGMRGIAAVCVVIFHFMEFATPDYKDNFIAHAYLAVDFFFCLSGFVIAYAYDHKIRAIGLKNFFKLRLIRLQPLVVIGAVIGLLAFVLDPFSHLFSVYGWWETFLMFLSSCCMIPYPLVHERYFNLFHLNPPSWSLFWEYVANIGYGFLLFRLGKTVLWTLVVIAATLLLFASYKAGYLGVGFGGDNFWGGGARIFYSFLAGMLVYRGKWIIRSKLGFGALGALLALAFLIPFAEAVNWIMDPLVVIFYFPFLVALGAGAVLNPRWEKLCSFSGEISYPLYMTHYPFLWLFYSYIEARHPSMAEMTTIIICGLLLLIAFSYLIMRFVDQPIRKYLKNTLKRT